MMSYDIHSRVRDERAGILDRLQFRVEIGDTHSGMRDGLVACMAGGTWVPPRGQAVA